MDRWRETIIRYRTLEERSRALALQLRRSGVGPEVPVAVCLRRTPRLPMALLAVLRAGGAYVPLDPDYPEARLRFMLEDSGALAEHQPAFAQPVDQQAHGEGEEDVGELVDVKPFRASVGLGGVNRIRPDEPDDQRDPADDSH